VGTGDDRKSNAGRDSSGYVTIPPELRAFVPAKSDATAKPAGTPELTAAAAELRKMNGGENADPFFFDTRGVAKAVERAEDDEPKGVGNAKVHVPAFALPSATATRAAATDAAEEDAEITVEKAASPWATEAAVAPIASSELPSALAPVAKTDPAPDSERPAGVVAPPGRLLRGVIAVVVIALLGFAAFQLMPKDPPKEQATPAPLPAPSGTASVAPAVPPLELGTTAASAVPVAPIAPPVGTAEIDAGMAAPVGPGPHKTKAVGPASDPYDASAPSPAKTVEAVVVPPAPTLTPVSPIKASATAPATAPDEEIFSRPKKKPEEGAKP
jgi:hypothetical protein